MASELNSRWEALLSTTHPDRVNREILFDPHVEDWAFSGLSESYRKTVRESQDADQARALLVDRLRWVIQKRLAGRMQEVMLLYLAGYSQNEIAEMLSLSRSTIKREMNEAAAKLKEIIQGSDKLAAGIPGQGLSARILPLDSEDDFRAFLEFLEERPIEHIALGTFADLREALVIYRLE